MASQSVLDADRDLHEALRAALERDVVHAALRAGALSDADPEMTERILAKAEAARLNMLASADEIPVEEDLHRSLACGYMEYKSQWVTRQVRICYEQMITGSCDQEVATESSMYSYFVDVLESLILPEHLKQINDLFASQLPG